MSRGAILLPAPIDKRIAVYFLLELMTIPIGEVRCDIQS
jgi:hypothetical protein